MAEAFRNLLLIQLGDIGDVVLTEPSIAAARRVADDIRVSLLVRKPYGCLYEADPHVHEIVELEKFKGSLLQRVKQWLGFIGRLRKARYDLVIDLRTGDRGAIMAWLTGAPVRIGRESGSKQWWHGLAFTRLLKDVEHAPPPAHPGADQSLRILRAVGIPTPASRPQLHVSPQALARARTLLDATGIDVTRGMITLSPYSRWQYKEWTDPRWGEVMDRIWEARRVPTVVLGAPDEAAACARLVAGREGRAVSLAGRTSLAELAAVISLSRMQLGVDSSAPHIAAALDVPSLTLHGPTDWRAWRLVDQRTQVLESRDLKALEAAEVVAAALKQFG